MNKTMLSIGLVLIALGTIGVSIYWDSYVHVAYVEDRIEFSPDGLAHLQVEANIGQVTVTKKDIAQVEVAYRVPDEFVTATGRPSIEQVGDTLAIGLHYKEGGQSVFSPWSMRRKVSVDVMVPEDFVFDELSAKMRAGQFQLTGQLANDVRVTSNLGQVKFDELTAKTIDVESDVGSIILNDVSGRIEAKSNIGEIRLRTDRITNHITARTDVGSIELMIGEKPENANVTATTDVGSARIFGGKENHIVPEAVYEVELTSDVGSVRVDTFE